MTTHFKNAAKRHYLDAQFLHTDSRWANADHLYGIAAECLLKAVIQILEPDSIDNETGDFKNIANNKRSPHKKHFEQNATNGLWNHFLTYNSGRLASQFTLPADNPFYDWDVFQRYYHENTFNENTVISHANAVLDLQRRYDESFSSGVI